MDDRLIFKMWEGVGNIPDTPMGMGEEGHT